MSRRLRDFPRELKWNVMKNLSTPTANLMRENTEAKSHPAYPYYVQIFNEWSEYIIQFNRDHFLRRTDLDEMYEEFLTYARNFPRYMMQDHRFDELDLPDNISIDDAMDYIESAAVKDLFLTDLRNARRGISRDTNEYDGGRHKRRRSSKHKKSRKSSKKTKKTRKSKKRKTKRRTHRK